MKRSWDLDFAFEEEGSRDSFQGVDRFLIISVFLFAFSFDDILINIMINIIRNFLDC